MNAVISFLLRAGATRSDTWTLTGAGVLPSVAPLFVGMRPSMSSRRLPRVTTRLDLEYDGTQFAGWARQPDKRTIQEELESALATILRIDAVPVTVAGRTDRGVHAWGQVVSYGHEAVDPRSLNGVLPDDVSVLAATPAADGFDARADAISRTYCYRVLNRRTRSPFWRDRALWRPGTLDREALHACAAVLPGAHDFTAFTPTDGGYVHFERTVLAAEWREQGDLLEFWITADAFLRHMNRILVGTMLEIAAGNRGLESFAPLLDGAPRSASAQTVAPYGLALASVGYPS
jgi:tRNA pseudouridine38-40 synthase